MIFKCKVKNEENSLYTNYILLVTYLFINLLNFSLFI